MGVDGAPHKQGSSDFGEGREKPKLVVILGPTGSGKSKLAVDLASHFPIEIISADSMQVYQGLDVLTNKVTHAEQKGVPHHLLGTVNPNVEFTAKDFRDSAIPIEDTTSFIEGGFSGEEQLGPLRVINNIVSRMHLPIVVGGTNYYIQALLSPFLLDDSTIHMGESCLTDPGNEESGNEMDEVDGFTYDHDHLREIDPIAANRIHPNNHRKIKQYLNLYFRTGILPSAIFQGKAAENWGQADSFRYNCCLICIDASVSQLDQHVDSRVDCMVASGLLDEVYDIYNQNADYTRGLRQAIGVREFEEFLRLYVLQGRCARDSDGLSARNEIVNTDKILKENMLSILNSSNTDQSSLLLKEAIANVKLNTRRLIRRQRRQLNRLKTLFGWKIYHVDATEYISCKLEDSWTTEVVDPAVRIIRSFLDDSRSASKTVVQHSTGQTIQKDLWTKYNCQACGNKELRGTHEWEQHKQGRVHRKRISRFNKARGFSSPQQQTSSFANNK